MGKRGAELSPEITEKQAGILAILKAHPEGVTVRELARQIGERVEIMYQRLNYLSLSAPIYDDAGRYFLLDWRRL